MSRLTSTETEMLLRWFLYNASREQMDLARKEVPVYFNKAWSEYVVKDYDLVKGEK